MTRSPGEVCFRSAEVGVDWQALAERQENAGELLHPGRAALERNYSEPGGVSYLHFEAPVSESLASTQWLLLHEQGVQFVRPRILRGSVRYAFDPRRSESPGPPAFSGEICVDGLNRAIVAAFVLKGPHLPVPTLHEIIPSYPAVGVATLTWGGAPYKLEAPRSSGARIQRALVLVGAASADLLLVRWLGEPESFCEVVFELFVLSEGRAVKAQSNAYGCDL